MMNKNIVRATKKIICAIICIIIIFVVIYPCLLLVYNTFYIENNLGIKVFSADDFFKTVLLGDLFWSGFFGSCYYTTIITFFQVALGTIMSFIFAKFNFPLKNIILFIYLMLMLMPFQVTMVPGYITLKTINLLNTQYAVILPQIFLPFGVLFVRYLMIKIPNTVIDAAKIDGASTLTIFFKIIIPSAKNGIILLFFLSFVDNWNLVEPMLVFNKEGKIKPLSVIMRGVIENAPENAFVAGILYMIPALIIFLIINKNIVRGIDVK